MRLLDDADMLEVYGGQAETRPKALLGNGGVENITVHGVGQYRLYPDLDGRRHKSPTSKRRKDDATVILVGELSI